MTFFALNQKERSSLEQVVRNTADARSLRRTQALLWLDEGESATEVADWLCVSRSVIYKWVSQFQERSELDTWARISDGARSGRPRTAHGIIDPLIDEMIDLDPSRSGLPFDGVDGSIVGAVFGGVSSDNGLCSECSFSH